MTSGESAPAPPAFASPHRTLSFVLLGVGALFLALSLCAVVAFLVAPVLRAQGALANNTAVVSVAVVLIGFGALLVLLGRGLQQDKLTAPFRLPNPLLLLGAYALVLLVGQGILALNLATPYLFPLWHVLASLLVPLAVLSFAAQRLPPVSTRSMLAQFVWGGLVTIVLALVFELLIGGFLVVAALVAIAVLLGAERMNMVAGALREIPPDTDRIVQILSQEPLAALVAFGAALALFVLIVPLLEEIIKASGPGLMIGRRVRERNAVTLAETLLWGLAAGAGYAFTENMFNGQGSLANSGGLVGIWAGAMLLRAGTSVMHMVATATVSFGWYDALVNKNLARGFVWLLAATALHALWNVGAVLLGAVTVLSNVDAAPGNLAVALTGSVLMLLGLLFVGGLVWLGTMLRRARRASPAPIVPEAKRVAGEIVSPSR